MIKHLSVNKIDIQLIWKSIQNEENILEKSQFIKELQKICLSVINSLEEKFPSKLKNRIVQAVTIQLWEHYKIDPYNRFLKLFPTFPTNDIIQDEIYNHISVRLKSFVLAEIKGIVVLISLLIFYHFMFFCLFLFPVISMSGIFYMRNKSRSRFKSFLCMTGLVSFAGFHGREDVYWYS